MPPLKKFLIIALFFLVGISACSGIDSASPVPMDLVFVMDVRSADEDLADSTHVNIRIDDRGRGQFEYYDTGGTIHYDLDKIVTYEPGQIVKSGNFKLTDKELAQLWNILNENNFFVLLEDYRAAIGHSYAFIMVEANGERYIVDNIGIEVPEIRTIVEEIRRILPQEIKFEYGKGVKL
jgi:hypothetical protein